MQDDKAGVVIFHVPKSRMAPHRHTVTKECYIRRADRTEKMTMREIQDLTLQVERGMAAIDRRFEERRAAFANMWERITMRLSKAFAMRASLVPLAPVYIERVHNNEAILPPAHAFRATTREGQPFTIDPPMQAGMWRPLVRGTTCVNATEHYNDRRSVFCDGLIEYLMFEGCPQLWINLDHVMAVAANAVLAAEQFRRAADAIDVEYGFEVEVGVRGGNIPVGYASGRVAGTLATVSNLRETFPRYSVGPREEFNKLLSMFERDILDATGEDCGFDSIISDFDLAFSELGFVAKGLSSSISDAR